MEHKKEVENEIQQELTKAGKFLVRMGKIIIRICLEVFKISPLVAFPLVASYKLKDYSQLQLAVYYMSILVLALGVFHVVRKFMFPTFSVEAHMASVKEDKNMASAAVILGFFAFLIAICFLVTWFMMASIPGKG